MRLTSCVGNYVHINAQCYPYGARRWAVKNSIRTGGNDLLVVSALFDEAFEYIRDRRLFNTALHHSQVRMWNDTQPPLCGGRNHLFYLCRKASKEVGFTQKFLRIVAAQLVLYFSQTPGIFDLLTQVSQ